MELYQLQYFVAIAKSGSFTKAADTLYVTQPTLSAAIKKLEKELGVALLERRWRGVRMTSAGEIFLAKAQNIIAEYQSTISTLRNFQDRPVLRLGMLCTLQVRMVSKIMQSFRELYPEVTLELHDTHLEELDNWLDQGDIDIAFTTIWPTSNPQTTHLLFKQRLLLGVPKTHPFARKKEILITELEDQPFIERIKCEVLKRESPPLFDSLGVHPRIVYRADHEEWVISLIQSGMGMSLMPEWDDVEGITYVPLAKMDPVRSIGLEWSTAQNVELVNVFNSFVKEGTWFDNRFKTRIEKA